MLQILVRPRVRNAAPPGASGGAQLLLTIGLGDIVISSFNAMEEEKSRMKD